MIAETWVINASPLILLGRLGRIDLLEQLAKQILVPASSPLRSSVRRSRRCGDRTPSSGHKIESSKVFSCRYRYLAGIWAQGNPKYWPIAFLVAIARLLDDGEARAAAKVHSVPLVGSLGVILRARKAGLLSTARPLVKQLIESGSYLPPELRRQALLKVDE